MLVGLGAGLVAIGAALLFASAQSHIPPIHVSGYEEHLRQQRNAEVTTLVAALVTVVGALLLLVPTRLVWAIAGVACGLLVYYLALARRTRREWTIFLAQIRRERERQDGRVTMLTLAETGVLASLDEELLSAPVIPYDNTDLAEEAESSAAAKATWRWALANPRGFDRRRWGITRHEQIVEALREVGSYVRRF
jgi:hypothetical protein